MLKVINIYEKPIADIILSGKSLKAFSSNQEQAKNISIQWERDGENPIVVKELKLSLFEEKLL